MTYPKKQAEAQMIFRKTGGFVQGNMTLRDHFAGLAMQSIVSILHQGIRPADIKTMCDDSYAIADTMLKAREA